LKKYNRIEEVSVEDLGNFDLLLDYGMIFEKIDGGNTLLEIENNGEILYSSRKAKPEPHSRAPWFGKFKEFVIKNYEALSRLNPATYYLEFLAPHTVEYKDEFVNKPFLLDVMLHDKYIHYEDAVEMIKKSGKIIKTLPVEYEGPITGKVVKEILFDNSSKFSKNGEREGLVLKDYDSGRFLKVLNPKVVEKRSDLDEVC
jgi:hypothetical protein